MLTAPALAETLDRVRHDAGRSLDPAEIVVDLRDVEFLSAAGMHVLVRAHASCLEHGMALRVVADHSAVTRPLRLTGLSQTLDLRSELDTRAT